MAAAASGNSSSSAGVGGGLNSLSFSSGNDPSSHSGSSSSSSSSSGPAMLPATAMMIRLPPKPTDNINLDNRTRTIEGPQNGEGRFAFIKRGKWWCNELRIMLFHLLISSANDRLIRTFNFLC